MVPEFFTLRNWARFCLYLKNQRSYGQMDGAGGSSASNRSRNKPPKHSNCSRKRWYRGRTSPTLYIDSVSTSTLQLNSIPRLCPSTLSLDSIPRLYTPTLYLDSATRLYTSTLYLDSVPRLCNSTLQLDSAT